MPFWRCYYHLVWTTKNREPLITPKIEPILFTIISTKCTELDCHLLAVNAVPDHIHAAVNMPPKLSIARWTTARHLLVTGSPAKGWGLLYGAWWVRG